MDSLVNFGKVALSTNYDAAATSIVLTAAQFAKLPQTAPYNLVWWNHTDYPSPEDDPSVEIIRVTALNAGTYTLTVARAQEGEAASAHNTAAKEYWLMNGLTKAVMDAVQTGIDGKAATVHTHLLVAGATDVTATAAELNKLDGVTATGAELNVLDGILPTVTELNFVDGVTSNIQTQLNAKVTGVSGTAPVVSSGGTAPAISMAAATALVDGYMANEYAAKLDGIAVSANNYVHPVTAGNIHVPAAGAATQLLQYSAAGTAKWVTPSGDTTMADGGAVTITNGAVALANMANMATGSLVYRKTALAGAPEVQTLAILKTDLGLTGTNSGDQSAVAVTITDAGGLFTAATVEAALQENRTAINLNTAKVTNASHTGDVTGSTVLTIAAGAVDLAMMANLAQDKIIGRATASTGVPEVIACTAVGRAIIAAATAAAQIVTLGVTATAAELNALDGILPTVTELNFVDGVTSNIQTQLGTKVVGPASFTDQAIVRADGVTGKLVQNSTVIITDAGNVGIQTTAPGSALTVVGNIASSGIAAPTNAAFTAGAGTLAIGTYYYRVTALTSAGETTPSAQTSLALAAAGGVNVNWVAVAGATGYKIYGRSTNAELYIASVAVGVVTYLDGGSITPAGAMPTSNTTGNVLLASNALGNVGIGTVAPLSKLSINGGLHVGGDSDAGDNNLLVDGTLTVGTTLFSAIGLTLMNDASAAAQLVTLGLTATAAELNALDGILPTVTELNFVDGVTSNIQTQLNAKVTNATHTGDVTGATALTIAAAAVDLAMMANMATGSLIYRKTALAGVPEVQTLATLKTDLGSMPASDVYAWAKAGTKPSYTYTEVGAPSTSDSRLSDARPASDVYAWAKAASPPATKAITTGIVTTSGSVSTVVTHGLGVTPTFIGITPYSSSGPPAIDFLYVIVDENSTTFTIRANFGVSVQWMAVA